MGKARPSIVVHTLLVGTEISWFDRWVDAVLSALTGNAAVDILGRWRIIAGDVSAEKTLDAVTVAHYEQLARAAGGEFVYSFHGASLGREADYKRLLEMSEEDLVLIVGSDTVILSSTVARMVRSLASDIDGIDARQLPLDGVGEPDCAAVETTDAGRDCVLFSRRILQERGGAGLSSLVGNQVDPPGGIRRAERLLTHCPGAVVFRDKRLPALMEVVSDLDGGSAGGSGSLLEEAMFAVGLDAARNIAARTLTETGAALLSVVMRTQALRPEALRDVLLCLAGQSDGRFELLLVVHNSDPEDARHILDDQPEWLKSRTQILTASRGTRSHPLNVGIAAARGTHVAFLDDDDLVFAHWVESFLAASLEHPRRVLRASAGVQRVRTTTWQGGIGGHMSESPISTPYPRAFNLADHLRVNMTPFMTFAFPRRFFAIFGGADESLEVCEDWDIALRAASILGVTDVPALTAIYRRWSSGDDSYSVHESAIWERDMARVHSKLDSSVLLLPAGSASELEQFSATVGVSAELAAVYGSSSWRITAPMRATARWTRRFQNWVVAFFRGRSN